MLLLVEVREINSLCKEEFRLETRSSIKQSSRIWWDRATVRMVGDLSKLRGTWTSRLGQAGRHSFMERMHLTDQVALWEDRKVQPVLR